MLEIIFLNIPATFTKHCFLQHLQCGDDIKKVTKHWKLKITHLNQLKLGYLMVKHVVST